MKAIHPDIGIPSPPPSIDIDHSETGKLKIVSNSLILKSIAILVSVYQFTWINFPFFALFIS